MANIRVKPKAPPIIIDKFLGLNEDTTGETNIDIAESPDMINFRVTENLKIAKREGYVELFASITSSDINGMWEGKVGNTASFLFACAGSLYKLNTTSGTYSLVGTVANNTVSMFAFNSKVYVIDGTNYKSYDGTNYGTVSGYVPKVTISTPPAGGGTLFEGVNVLTGAKRQSFNTYVTASSYTLATTSLTSVDYAKYAGSTLTTSLYTYSTATGVVTFTTASIADWVSGQDTLEIGWTKGTGSRQEVTKNLYAMLYGGKNDTKVHLFGNPDNKNTIVFSGLADEVPSAEYFPETNYNTVGSDEYAITDVVKQYDRQIILKEKDSFFSTYALLADDSGSEIASLETYPLNDTIGNVAPNQVRIIQNNPFTLFSGVYEFTQSTIRDEKNVQYISKKVEPSLNEVDLSTAITVDWEKRKEYWICVGETCWVFNYRNGIWYKFDNIPAVCFLVANDELYFGTSNGQIMRFDNTKRSDDGEDINAYWGNGFNSLGAETLEKYADRLFVGLKPEPNCSIDTYYETNNDGLSDVETFDYNLATFKNANFAKWSFGTNYRPTIFKRKIRAKRFNYIKTKLINNSSTDTATITSVSLQARTGGEA